MKRARARLPACLAAPAQAKAWPMPANCWKKSPLSGPKTRERPFGPAGLAESALFLGPDVKHHGMVNDFKTVLVGDLFLTTLNGLVKKLEHFAGFKTDHVIVMITLIQLIAGLLNPAGAVVKNMLAHQVGRLKLRQHPVNRGQTDFLALVDQRAVNVIGRHVLLFGGLKKTENLAARVRHLQSGLFQVVAMSRHESPPQSLTRSLN